MQIATRPHISIAEFDPDDAKLDITCPSCGTVQHLEVDCDSLHHWVTGGGLVQRCFPDLSASDREALMTGICDTCWDQMGED